MRRSTREQARTGFGSRIAIFLARCDHTGQDARTGLRRQFSKSVLQRAVRGKERVFSTRSCGLKAARPRALVGDRMTSSAKTRRIKIATICSPLKRPIIETDAHPRERAHRSSRSAPSTIEFFTRGIAFDASGRPAHYPSLHGFALHAAVIGYVALAACRRLEHLESSAVDIGSDWRFSKHVNDPSIEPINSNCTRRRSRFALSWWQLLTQTRNGRHEANEAA